LTIIVADVAENALSLLTVVKSILSISFQMIYGVLQFLCNSWASCVCYHVAVNKPRALYMRLNNISISNLVAFKLTEETLQ